MDQQGQRLFEERNLGPVNMYIDKESEMDCEIVIPEISVIEVVSRFSTLKHCS